MSETEARVAAHYTTGSVLARIDAALADLGLDPQTASAEDLKPVDEFHTGGFEATSALLDQLQVTPEMRVVDIGAGLGGTARFVAATTGAHVTGIDLTPEYVEAGRVLTERAGLADRVDLREGSATALPLDDGAADLALMFHVGMNIAEKDLLMQEAARVLRPGGRFAIFDVMRDEGEGPLVFPVPWASRAETSFVDPPEVYQAAAAAAGMVPVAMRARRQFALDFFAGVFRRVQEEGSPPLGLHLLMGPEAGDKLRNYVANIEARRLVPVEMIFARP